MNFDVMNEREYRSLNTDAYGTRRELVLGLAEELPEDATDEQMRAIDAEVEIIRSEDERRHAVVELRNAKASRVASGVGAVKEKHTIVETDHTEDAMASPEYERAFAAYITRGVEIPHEFAQYQTRQDKATTVADSGIMVPTTVSNRIIEEMKEHGILYPRVSKTNVPGGIDFPVVDFKPEAHWIGETQVSETQNATQTDKVSFKYHGLEVRTARTLLQNAVTLSAFNQRFVDAAANAMADALDAAIVNGDGAGKFLGITKDPRITNKQKMKAKDLSFAGFHKIKAAIKRPYRDGIFIMNQATFDANIEGMVDTNGQPVGRINYGINGEETYRFMGKTVLTVPDAILPSYDSAEADAVFMIYAKLTDYLFNSNLQMRADNWEDLDHNLFKTRHILIADGKVLDPYGMMLVSKDISA
ncbi:phage major capsid protein [uncultured Olegusella sp.]|uniref:phage major capsid protein n=1 Tax=uncultured Olegusella sp. TaxID=1979846 RepID=UPI00260A6791|nr:phage major capsid protein [uncultured Olegusella sp.]